MEIVKVKLISISAKSIVLQIAQESINSFELLVSYFNVLNIN